MLLGLWWCIAACTVEQDRGLRISTKLAVGNAHGDMGRRSRLASAIEVLGPCGVRTGLAMHLHAARTLCSVGRKPCQVTVPGLPHTCSTQSTTHGDVKERPILEVGLQLVKYFINRP